MSVSISSYGNYANDNYGNNTIKVNVETATFYFSYQTCVAFHTYQTGLVVCENVWSTTTGKHLNWIDGGDKEGRLPYREFQAQLAEVTSNFSLPEVRV